MNLYAFFILLLNFNTIKSNPIEINDEHTVDYFLQYQGNVPNNTNHLAFSTGLDNNTIINTFDNISECKLNCAYDNECRGVYEYINNSNTICNTLSDLGTFVFTNKESYSYRKILYHTHVYNDNDIQGEILTLGELVNETVYLDINHNNILDDNEPNITTNSSFLFTNLNDGNYLVKIHENNDCTITYPTIFGGYSTVYSDGYVDVVYKYYSHNGLIMGGNVGHSPSIQTSLSNIIGSNPTNYLSFYPNDYIILAFTDDTIIDTPGIDIVFSLYNSNNYTLAHVSVRNSNYEDFNYLGVLSNTTFGFDLSTINYEYPVNQILLHFFSNNNSLGIDNSPINIINVYGDHTSLYFPAYSYNINIPGNNRFLVFVNDCEYNVQCSKYCDYHMFSWDNYLSCLEGCILFENTNNCMCENINTTELAYYSSQYNYLGNSNNFEENNCYFGCEYGFKRFLFPNYTLFTLIFTWIF